MIDYDYYSTACFTTTLIFILFSIFDLCHSADFNTNKINRIAYPYQNSRVSPQRDVPDSKSDDNAPDNQKFFGSNTEIKDYDTSEFNYIGGGPVRTGDELSTDFSAPSCWSNTGKAKLQWKSAHNQPETKKLQYYFNTGNGPDNDYVVAFSRSKIQPNDYAQFESCSISCASGPVKVSLKYWMSQGVILEVCHREVFFEDGEPGDCQKLPAQSQPGPVKLSLNVKELSAVVIRASNFIDDSGSVAMIDDMEIDYKPCEETTVVYTTAKTTTPSALVTRVTPGGPGGGGLSSTSSTSAEFDNAETCRNIVCSFDQSMCSYKNLQFQKTSANVRQFSVQHGRFRNLLTGIREGPQGAQDGYTAAYLLRQEIAGIESSGQLDLQDDRVLQGYLYEATHGMTTRLCLNDQFNCPYKTEGVIQKNERKWKLMYWPIPKGTKKILLIAENKGTNEGAVGLSSLRLLAKPSNGNDPQTATRSTCLLTRSKIFA